MLSLCAVSLVSRASLLLRALCVVLVLCLVGLAVSGCLAYALLCILCVFACAGDLFGGVGEALVSHTHVPFALTKALVRVADTEFQLHVGWVFRGFVGALVCARECNTNTVASWET